MQVPTLFSGRTLAIGNAIAFAANTIITFSSNAPIYGKTNSQVSNMFGPHSFRPSLISALTHFPATMLHPTSKSRRFATLLTPAGWAFSIWGLIFAAEGAWAAWQSLPRNHGCRFTAAIGVWWWLVCVAQCCWTFSFAQVQIGLSLAFMLLILFALASIAAALSKHRAVIRPSGSAYSPAPPTSL